MVKISLILVTMPGGKFYAKRGLKRNITVYLKETTYNTLLMRAKVNEWSLQTLVRRILEASAQQPPKDKPSSF